MRRICWQAQNARAELGNLEAELAVAAPALDAAQLAEHKASAEFAALVAPVLERSAAAEAACNAALSALEGSWLRRMEFIAHDVKQLAAQVGPLPVLIKTIIVFAFAFCEYIVYSPRMKDFSFYYACRCSER